MEVATFREGVFWYGTDRAEMADKPAWRVRVIRVASPQRKHDVWLVTNVLDPRQLSAESAAGIRLVNRTTGMLAREAEGSLLACQLLLVQGASALQAGGPREGRDADLCSASGVLRELRREWSACAVPQPRPRTSFARRLQGCGRDRGARTGAKVRKEHPRRKKHVMPAPPRLKVLSAEQRLRIEAMSLKEEAA